MTTGLVLISTPINKNRLYQFHPIHTGDYGVKIIAPGTNDFELDTLHFETGDIKELIIGLIKNKICPKHLKLKNPTILSIFLFTIRGLVLEVTSYMKFQFH